VGQTSRDAGRPEGASRTDNEPGPPREPLEEPSGPLGDLIRRFTALGLSSFFTTESAIRKAFGDTVPQEWVDFITDQGERGRQELFDRLAAEAGRVLERVDLEELLENLLTGRTIEIEAKVRIGARAKTGGEDAPTEGGERVKLEVDTHAAD
jgi:hypothetical protein